jgi:hypothetical protein
MRTRLLTWIVLLYAGVHIAHAAPIEITSPVHQTMLLELYTSEGCSSCPPADRWLSGFKTDARLWREIVPVAFHVDYWNSLGWRDRFSDARYTARQHNYYQHDYTKGVYTPGLMTNGREWRDWFGIRKLPRPSATEVGVLKAIIDTNAATVEFIPAKPMPSPLTLNVAFLGFDQTTAVAGGENRGKELLHDFVVLTFQQIPQAGDASRPRWELTGLADLRPEEATGIALWITAHDDPTPIQTAGGWLPP